jgi:TPR repeat protein
MHRLGQECHMPEEKRRWLQMAAEEGYVPAMYDLAMLSDNPREKRWWLREAARNGWQEAIVELAETEC